MSGNTAKPVSVSEPLLSVRSLSVEFGRGEGTFQAVKNISFDVQPGKTLAIVGESGFGQICDLARDHAADRLHRRTDQQR